MPNKLAAESSPYLRQHAHNPVDWYPWGPEALERARTEDRPILLSVGYSSCHWCHVMERESFEDPATARLMNELFVNVKVDREERPDVDQIYMKAVQAMTGGGGWPMTVFLTPEGVPWYGGTYFPPRPRHGLPSFTQVLAAAGEAWRDRRDQVVEGGTKLLEALARSSEVGASVPLDDGVLDQVQRALAQRFDTVHGGFGGAPKFPQPVTLELLLRHHVRTGAAESLHMAVHTLRSMAAGGLRDHLAGGFHRYSVDARWLVPHFEKMLYDNALLARAYLDAWRVTGSDDLREVAVQTLEYLLSDMRSPEGGFYSARDADSEGKEGKYYVWTTAQVGALLEREEARLFARLYDVTATGNFEGANILHLPHEPEAVARSEGMTAIELEQRMAAARDRLLAARAEREAPFRDEKVIVAWNAMTLRALAEAGPALGRPDFTAAARACAELLWTGLRPEGRLLHTWMEGGEAKIPGFLDDHAALGNALLSLHGATLEARWLDATRWLCDEILERFWDETEGTAFDTPTDAEALVLRPRDPMDNATPSGPSLAAELLVRASHAFGEERYAEVARRIVAHDSAVLGRYGPAFGRMLSVLDRTLSPPTEVAIVGRGDADTEALVRVAHEGFHSNGLVVGRLEGEEVGGVPLLEQRRMVDDRPTAYACRAYACRLPVTDPEALRRELAALA